MTSNVTSSISLVFQGASVLPVPEQGCSFCHLPSCLRAVAEKITRVWNNINLCIQQLWSKLFSRKSIPETFPASSSIKIPASTQAVSSAPIHVQGSGGMFGFKGWDDFLSYFFPSKQMEPVVLPTIEFSPAIQEMKRVYRSLGTEKWREVIDGEHHCYGKEVYDKGLHGRTVEPGYLAGMEKGMDYIEETLGQPMTPQFYLKLHKIVCGHFRGAENGTLMGQERVGVFRNIDDFIRWNGLTGKYQMTPSARQEFERLHLGTIEQGLLGDVNIIYRPMPRYEVEQTLKQYIEDYEKEIAAATTADGKLLAIARFTQRHDWLHPVRDGCGRLEQLLTGKLLVENGFHPTVLQLPYLSGCRDVYEWKEAIKKGLVDWEKVRSEIRV